jgi:hypothetical protein
MWKRLRFASVVFAVTQLVSVAAAQRIVTESGAISGTSEHG